MVQIIQSPERKSNSQQFGEAFSRLIQGASGHLFKEQLRKREEEEEKEKEKRSLRGKEDLLRTEYGLKGDLELRKQEDKFNEKQKLLNNIGLGQFLGSEEAGSQLQGMSNESPLQKNQNNLIPEQNIYAAESIGEHGLAQQMREHNNGIIRQQQHQQNLDLRTKESERREKISSPEYQRQQKINAAQAKIDTDYNKQLQQSATQHKIKNDTLDRLEKLNNKGITGKPYEKLLEKAGLVSLTSEGRREFSADVKNLITDIRSILGAQFTGFEFQTILNAYPSSDFSKEANSAIIRNLKEFQDIRHQELEIAKELKKENGGKIPLDFQSKVNEKLQEYANSRLPEIRDNNYQVMKAELGIPKENVLMFSPDGEPLNVPANEVEKYESIGATLFPIG